MFTGGTLLLLAYAAIVAVWILWPEIKARLISSAAPAPYLTFDCKGGVHQACETCSCSCHLHSELAWLVAHESGMNARAASLGYSRTVDLGRGDLSA